ncbi:MAG: hypothetical protein HY056_12445 [Proteobacteria bacterium]|nr:hypothetical protein [Pseudomonadota bacterium]
MTPAAQLRANVAALAPVPDAAASALVASAMTDPPAHASAGEGAGEMRGEAMRIAAVPVAATSEREVTFADGVPVPVARATTAAPGTSLRPLAGDAVRKKTRRKPRSPRAAPSEDAFPAPLGAIRAFDTVN